jgi:pyruvate dehydrogenase phosphatase
MSHYSADAYGVTDLGWEGESGWTYSKVEEPKLSSMLTSVANPKSITGVDCITFQPCLIEDQANQDRYAVENWELSNGTWKFLAIFDGVYNFNANFHYSLLDFFYPFCAGHAGHETVDYTVATLPSLLKSALISLLQSTSDATPDAVSDVLRTTIISFDNSLAQDFLDLFPGGTKTISKLTDKEIRKIINDQAAGGRSYAKVSRCMQGSTVLVSLIDPSRENVWVASLGDCQAG